MRWPYWHVKALGCDLLPTRIVKVGGSLFDWPNLPSELIRWLNTQPPAKNVLIAGGGKLADAIRAADACYHLDAAVAHELSLSAMSVTAQLLTRILMKQLPDRPFESEFRFPELLSWLRKVSTIPNEFCVFDVEPFLRVFEAGIPGMLIPHDWSATSDSIAVRVGEVLKACDVVLLKSTLLPLNTTCDEAAAAGYVDRFFPVARQSVPQVRCVDLRDVTWPERMF